MGKRSRLLPMCLLCAAALGCSFDQRRRDKYLDAHPDLSPEFREAIKAGKARVGMSVPDVMASFGSPTKRVMVEDEKEGHLSKWIYDYSYYVETDPFYDHRDYYSRHYRYSRPTGMHVRSGTEIWFRGDKVVRVEDY